MNDNMQFEYDVVWQLAELNRRLNADLQRERVRRIAAETVLAQNGIEIARIRYGGEEVEHGDPVTVVAVERESDGADDRPLPEAQYETADGDGYTEAINRGDVDPTWPGAPAFLEELKRAGVVW